MQSLGVLLSVFAVWFMYCGSFGLRPIALLLAIVRKPDSAGQIIEDAKAAAAKSKYQYSTIAGDIVNGGGDGATGGGVAGAIGVNPWAGLQVTAPYGQQGHAGTFGAAHRHNGVDYAMPVGTPLPAVLSGTALPGVGALSGNTMTITGTGMYKGWETIYMHMSSVGALGPVVSGQIVGKSGGAKGAEGSGDSTGPHLHFEVHYKGQVVDPATYWTWLAAHKQSTSGSSGGGGRPAAVQ